MRSKCAAHASPATAALRAADEREARHEFRARRRRLFPSQMVAADALGVDDSTIARWEAGQTSVPGWALKALERLEARAKHLPLSGGGSERLLAGDYKAASGSTPTAPSPNTVEPAKPAGADKLITRGVPSEGNGPAEPCAGQRVDSPRESAAYSKACLIDALGLIVGDSEAA